MDNLYDYADSNQFQGEAPRETSAPRTGEMSGAIKIAHTLFIAALFVMPFIFIPIPGWSVSVGKIVVTALLALSGGAAIFASVFGAREVVLPRTYSAILAGVFVMLVLSTVFSSSISASFMGASLEVGTFYTTALALMLALVAPLVLTSRKRLVSALGALFLGGGVLGLFHLIRLFAGPGFLSFGYFTVPASTPAGSWNDLGIFFGVVYLISLVSLALGSLPGRARTLLTVALVVSLAFVALVNFRLLSVLLALTTLGLLLVSFLTQKQTGMVPAVISFVFLLMLSIFAGPIGQLSGNLFNTSYAEIRPNWSSTGDMLGAGLSDIKNIVLGSGPNTFTYLWQQERAPEVISSDFWSIDFAFSAGIIPTFAVTLGLITVAGLLALAGYLAFSLYKLVLARDTDPLLTTIAIGSGFAAVFLWILSIVYVFSGMIFLLMFALTGMAVAALSQLGRVRTLTVSGVVPTGSLVGIVGAVVCVALLVPALAVSASRTIYGQGVIQANTAEDIEGVAAAQAKIRQASMFERNDAFARTETELNLLRIQEFLSRENTDESDIQPFTQLVQVTREAADRALVANPRNYFNWVNSGLVYETLGLLEVENAFERAAESYAQARALNPTNPELILIQARLERARENTEAARAFAEEAIALKENYADAYLLLADIELVEEDTAGAIAQIETAIEASPRNAFLHYQLGLVHYSEDAYESAIEAFSQAIALDPNYANARYFRALSYVYGENDTEEALQDLRFISEQNAENEVLQSVIANIEAGNDPLEGIAEEDPGLSEDAGGTPETNAEAIENLEEASNPENQTQQTTETNTDSGATTEEEVGGETAE